MSLSGVCECLLDVFVIIRFIFCAWNLFSEVVYGSLWLMTINPYVYARDGHAGDDDGQDCVRVLFIWFETHKHTGTQKIRTSIERWCICVVMCMFACCKFPWFMRHSFHFNYQWAVSSRVKYFQVLLHIRILYIYLLGFFCDSVCFSVSIVDYLPTEKTRMNMNCNLI